MSAENQTTDEATETDGTRSEDEVSADREKAAPTDFRKHFWLLVAILVTVVLAAIVGRVWMAAPSGSEAPPGTPDRYPADVPRQP